MSTVTLSVTTEVTKEAIQIVKSLSLGLRAKDIGEKMEISPRTVEAKIDLLKKDYGAVTHSHLVGIFLRNHIID